MDVETIRQRALGAIGPLKPANNDTQFVGDIFFYDKRTDAGRNLPPYFLVYFLLVDLLGFTNLGRAEKVAWSIPVDLEGKGYLIDFRKFGLGIFAERGLADETGAEEIAHLVRKATKIAYPYFEHRAAQAVSGSALSIINYSGELFDGFTYLLNLYSEKHQEAERRKDEAIETRKEYEGGGRSTLVTFPGVELRREASWLAMAVIESFFSWTEHVFVHLAIMLGKCRTGEDVADLAEKDWAEKYKTILEVTDPAAKRYLDDLIEVRRQLRNFIAHGAFGKQREAFRFHSGTGAVPVRLPTHGSQRTFRLGHGVDFVEPDAIALITKFIDYLWSGPLGPARIYLQEGRMPTVLSMAVAGDYRQAMVSDESMTEFTSYWSRVTDDATNMDF